MDSIWHCSNAKRLFWPYNHVIKISRYKGGKSIEINEETLACVLVMRQNEISLPKLATKKNLII